MEMIILGIFSSIEFYVIAITVALIFVGFAFNQSQQSPAFTYIFSADIEPSTPISSGDPLSISVQALADGTLLLRRENVLLPEGATAHVTADLVGDKLTLTEKHTAFAAPMPATAHDISVRLDCLKAKRYHLRYEIPEEGLWAVAVVVNHSEIKSQFELQH